MPGQNFNLLVPFSNSSLTCGAGPVKGVSVTTTDNKFVHAGAEVVIEAKGQMRLASTALLAMGGVGGVVIGTPATICATAGGGVQIYAGAGLTPTVGGPGGPGAPFGPPAPASFEAGEFAVGMNKFNDGVKAVGDIAGGAWDGATADNTFDKAKAAFAVAKGGWDLAKAGGAESKGVDTTAKVVETGLKGVEVGIKISKGDYAGAAASAAGIIGKGLGLKNNDDSIKALKAANAAKKAESDAATQAGGPGAPSDGARIVEIAPENIDRKVGIDMTSKVGGKKTTEVDGNIESVSGASHSMKAFNKIETSSMIFDAYANISATMKGLAIAKVESLGIVSIDGKAKVKVESKVKIALAAPKVEVEGKASWTLTTPKAEIKSPNVLIGAGAVKIDSKTEITKQLKVLGSIVGKKSCHLDESLEVKGGACVHKNLKVKGSIKNGSYSAS